MKDLMNVVSANLVLLTLYSVLIHLASVDAPFILLALFIGIHTTTNFIMSLAFFSGGNKELGRAYLLSSGLVLLIGFSTCLGSDGLLYLLGGK